MILNEKINSFKAVVTSISIENTKIHLKILIQYEMSSRRFSNYIDLLYKFVLWYHL